MPPTVTNKELQAEIRALAEMMELKLTQLTKDKDGNTARIDEIDHALRGNGDRPGINTRLAAIEAFTGNASKAIWLAIAAVVGNVAVQILTIVYR